MNMDKINVKLNFSKMHGLGNDYVVINEFNGEIIPEDKKPAAAKELCKRGFSVGADGVIFVAQSNNNDADIRFRIFNADGSEAEMCGNGIRCFAKYVYENNILPVDNMLVETRGGVKKLLLNAKNGKLTSIKVDMGLATFNPREIPMKTDEDEFMNKVLIVDNKPFSMTILSVGNPHAVIFTENLKNVNLNEIGPLIENHEAFPERINAHFVHILDENEVEMITWERGSGVTMACGTGATSSVIAGYRLGFLENDVLVHLPGGELHINVYRENDIIGAYMEGDATMVFKGSMELHI